MLVKYINLFIHEAQQTPTAYIKKEQHTLRNKDKTSKDKLFNSKRIKIPYNELAKTKNLDFY